MSKLQIDRILGKDLSDFDKKIEAKINSIDQISDCLTQRSKFINQFQEMLKVQITNMKDKGQNSISSCTLFENNNDLKIQSKRNDEQLHVDINTSRKNIDQLDKIDDNTTERYGDSLNNCQMQYLSEVKIINQHQQKQIEIQKVIVQFQFLKKQMQNVKNLNQLIKEQIFTEINTERNNILQYIKQSFANCFLAINNVYQGKMESLIQQNDELKKKIQNYEKKVQDNPFNAFSFRPDNALKQINFNNTTKLPLFQEDKKTITSIKISTLFDDSVIVNKQNLVSENEQNQPKWKKMKRNSMHDVNDQSNSKIMQKRNCYITGNFSNEKKQKYLFPYDLPCLKPLTVGVPPIKNGFGILKVGTQTIYKGMWKNGKFYGKGKLTFDMYLYEGDFVDGVFHGHGSLKTEGMNFMGIFRNHMADGEGTVIKNGENISGIWSKNKFVQSF